MRFAVSPAVRVLLSSAAALRFASVAAAAKPPVASPPAAGAATPPPMRPDECKSIAWRSVGPANMGGRCSAIALVPGSRTSFYLGFGTGGVFKTENTGVTFKPVFDETGVASIGAIAVADAPAD